MMDGRVKTLHPKIHGGILCRHDHAEDMQALAEHGIATFELVVVNLYPFEADDRQAGRDAGRSDRADRHRRAEPGPRRGEEPRLRRRSPRSPTNTPRSSPKLQAAAARRSNLRQTAGRRGLRAHRRLRRAHRRLSSSPRVQFGGRDDPVPAERCTMSAQSLPSNRAALRREPAPEGGRVRRAGCRGASLVTAQQLNGKELSYNNLLDLDSALAIVRPARPAGRRGHQAQQPLRRRHRRRRWPTAAAKASTAIRSAPSAACSASIARSMPRRPKCSPSRACSSRRSSPPFRRRRRCEILTTKPKWKANVRLLAVGPLGTPPPAHWQLSARSRAACSCKRPTCCPTPKPNGKSSPRRSRRPISCSPTCGSPGPSCGT